MIKKEDINKKIAKEIKEMCTKENLTKMLANLMKEGDALIKNYDDREAERRKNFKEDRACRDEFFRTLDPNYKAEVEDPEDPEDPEAQKDRYGEVSFGDNKIKERLREQQKILVDLQKVVDRLP